MSDDLETRPSVSDLVELTGLRLNVPELTNKALFGELDRREMCSKLEETILDQLPMAYGHYEKSVQRYNQSYKAEISIQTPEVIADKIKAWLGVSPERAAYLLKTLRDDPEQAYILVVTPNVANGLQIQGLPNLVLNGDPRHIFGQYAAGVGERVIPDDSFTIALIEKKPHTFRQSAKGALTYLKGLNHGGQPFLRTPSFLEFCNYCDSLPGFGGNINEKQRYDETTTVFPEIRLATLDTRLLQELLGVKIVRDNTDYILSAVVWGNDIKMGVISPNTPLSGLRLAVV